MRLGHEFVEMGAALVLDRRVLEEQIHQHGLAAADLAMHVKPARRRVALVAEQPSQQAELLRRLVTRQPFLERGERLGSLGLRRISLDRPGGDEGLVLVRERGRRQGPLTASSEGKLQAVNRWAGYANATRHPATYRSFTHSARRNPRPHRAHRRWRHATRTARS